MRDSHAFRLLWSLLSLALLSACPSPHASDPANDPGAGPVSSSPIAVSRDGSTVWVVNPDSDTIGKIDASSGTLLEEIAVGDNPRTLTLSPEGHPALGGNFVFVAPTRIPTASRA